MDKVIVLENPVIKLLQTDSNGENKVIVSSEPTIIKVETASDVQLNLYIDETKLVPVDTTHVRPSVGMAFTDLIDAPSSLVGQAGKAVIVNSSEQGLTFGSSSGVSTSTNEDDCVLLAVILGS